MLNKRPSHDPTRTSHRQQPQVLPTTHRQNKGDDVKDQEWLFPEEIEELEPILDMMACGKVIPTAQRLINHLELYSYRQLRLIYKHTVHLLGKYVKSHDTYGRLCTVQHCRKRNWLLRRERAIMHIFDCRHHRKIPKYRPKLIKDEP